VKKYTVAFLSLVVILVVASSVLYAFANDTNEYIPFDEEIFSRIGSEEPPCPYMIAQMNDIVEQYADYLSRMGLQLYLAPVSVIESPQQGRRYIIQTPMIKRLSEDSAIEISERDLEIIIEAIGLLKSINNDGIGFDQYFMDALEANNLHYVFHQLLRECIFKIVHNPERLIPSYVFMQMKDMVGEYADYFEAMGLYIEHNYRVYDSPSGRYYYTPNLMIRKIYSEDAVIEISEHNLEVIMEVVALSDSPGFFGISFDPYFMEALKSNNLYDKFRQLMWEHISSAWETTEEYTSLP